MATDPRALPDDQLRVAAYGPDPKAPYRTGGVASWIGYLEDIGRVADIDIIFLYVDAPAPSWLRVPKFLRVGVGSFLAAFRLFFLGRDQIDVLHVNSSLYRRVAFRDAPIVLAARIRRIPVLLQIHGGRLDNLDQVPVSRLLWELLFRAAAGLGIFPGPQWEEFRGAGYREKMKRIFNVVPSTGISADTASDRVEFLFLGRVAAEKGVDKLLNAFLRLRERGHKSARLTIAGEGPQLQSLRQTVNRSGQVEAVSMPGYVRGEGLERVMVAANVFVLPSYREGFPLSFLEAGERGMACLATENSAIPEVFEAGVHFLPLKMEREGDLYEKMKWITEDKKLRVALGAAIENAVQSCCTVERSAGKLAALYRDVADSETN